MKKINRALKVIRQFHNLNQSETGAKLGVSQVVISRIESGESVSLIMLQRYANAFKIPLWQLLFFIEQIDENSVKVEILRELISEKTLKLLEFIIKQSEIEELKK